MRSRSGNREPGHLARLLFMGTPQFGVPILCAVQRAGYDLAAVVTQPDRPAGRGRALTASPVKLAALELGLGVLQPASVREPAFLAAVAELRCDAIVVAAFGQMLPSILLQMPLHGCLNVHASLLPDLRGASPVAAAIGQGYSQTGVSIMLMDDRMDTGPILSQRKCEIDSAETGSSLTNKLADVGADLLVQTLPAWLDGQLEPTPQDDLAASYTKPLRKTDGQIDWSSPASDIERKTRAYHPWPGTHTRWQGKMLKVLEALVLTKGTAGTPGQVQLATGTDGHPAGPAVVCGDGFRLLLTRVQTEGRAPVAGVDFARGAPGFIGSTIG